MPTLQPNSWSAELWSERLQGWLSIGPSGGPRYLYRTRDCAYHCHLSGEFAFKGERRIVEVFEPPNMPLMCPHQKRLAKERNK